MHLQKPRKYPHEHEMVKKLIQTNPYGNGNYIANYNNPTCYDWREEIIKNNPVSKIDKKLEFILDFLKQFE